jgi:hypothetical protein
VLTKSSVDSQARIDRCQPGRSIQHYRRSNQHGIGQMPRPLQKTALHSVSPLSIFGRRDSDYSQSGQGNNPRDISDRGKSDRATWNDCVCYTCCVPSRILTTTRQYVTNPAIQVQPRVLSIAKDVEVFKKHYITVNYPSQGQTQGTQVSVQSQGARPGKQSCFPSNSLDSHSLRNP